MTALVFVDTNIFVHRHDRSDPARQARAEEWIAHLARSRTGRLSFQVLQEFYVTLTGKARIGFDPAEAREIVRELAVWQPVAIELGILERAWHIQDGHSVSLVGRRRRRGGPITGLLDPVDRGSAAWACVRGGSGGRPVPIDGTGAR